MKSAGRCVFFKCGAGTKFEGYGGFMMPFLVARVEGCFG